jgi:uncharacterized protein
MTRILFWVALAFLIVAAVRAKLRANIRRQQEEIAARARRQGPAAPAVTAEPMLCCAHCGMYYPASENVPAGGRDYCSAAHTPAA